MTSLWQATAELPKFPTLNENIKTDVLIIGGGMAGILTAYMLKDRGIEAVVVEKDRICSSTTGNTTAKITIQHGLIYHKLLEDEGIVKAKGYMKANKAALKKYGELCRHIDCDYEVKDNYVYTLSDRQKLEYELNALHRMGYMAELRESLPLPIDTAGGIRFKDQAQFHPLKFVSAIAKDLTIYENTHVLEMIGNMVVTDRGNIHADKVVVATHFPFINKHGSYFLKLYQHRSYVIALENATDVNGMYVDDDKKGLSFRSYGDLLLLGGGGHRTGKHGGSYGELRDFAAKHYPDSAEKYHWAAQDCMSLDSVPYIGRYSKSTHDLYVATGFNKWGMTGSMTAAMLLADKISDTDNEYAEVFDPSRSMLKPQLALNALEATLNLLTPTKKRCPHLGCALKWNPQEHSWDCPCHGSRFTKDGKVLNNPANTDMKI